MCVGFARILTRFADLKSRLSQCWWEGLQIGVLPDCQLVCCDRQHLPDAGTYTYEWGTVVFAKYSLAIADWDSFLRLGQHSEQGRSQGNIFRVTARVSVLRRQYWVIRNGDLCKSSPGFQIIRALTVPYSQAIMFTNKNMSTRYDTHLQQDIKSVATPRSTWTWRIWTRLKVSVFYHTIYPRRSLPVLQLPAK